MGKPVSDEDWTKFSAGRDTPSGGDSGETTWTGDIARGLGKGALSNVTGLWSAATNLTGTNERLGPPKALTDWVDSPGDTTETIARQVGDYGSLMIPGLDLGLGAKFGTKAAQWAFMHGPELAKLAKVFGPKAAQSMVESMWHTLPKVGEGVTKGAIGGMAHDPEHPLQGAATGATVGGGGMLARKAIPAAWNKIPAKARQFAATAGAVTSGMGIYDIARNAIGHGWFPGEYHLAYSLPSSLAALAAFATGKPGAMGGFASSLNRGLSEDDQPPLDLPLTMPDPEPEPQPSE